MTPTTLAFQLDQAANSSYPQYRFYFRTYLLLLLSAQTTHLALIFLYSSFLELKNNKIARKARSKEGLAVLRRATAPRNAAPY